MPPRWAATDRHGRKTARLIGKRPTLIKISNRSRGALRGRHVPKPAVDVQASLENAFGAIQTTGSALGALEVLSDHVAGLIPLRGDRLTGWHDPNPDLLEPPLNVALA